MKVLTARFHHGTIDNLASQGDRSFLVASDMGTMSWYHDLSSPQTRQKTCLSEVTDGALMTL